MRGFLVLVAVLLASGGASAYEVYINGVKVTGLLRDQTFEHSTVVFDANGDVQINAPGYKIEIGGAEVPPAAVPPTPQAAQQVAPSTDRYWLIVEAPTKGHYKTLIQANGQPVADIPASQPQYVLDVTTKVIAGANQFQVTFLPTPDAPVVPETDAVNVMLGYGAQAADGTLTIKRVLGKYNQKTGRKAAEAQVLSFDAN